MGASGAAHGLYSPGSVVMAQWAPAAPWHVESSPTRDQTFVPCAGRQILLHCATREVPDEISKCSIFILRENSCLLSICSKLTSVLGT